MKHSTVFKKAQAQLGINRQDAFYCWAHNGDQKQWWSCLAVAHAATGADRFALSTALHGEHVDYYTKLFAPRSDGHSQWLSNKLGHAKMNKMDSIIDPETGLTELQALRFMMLCFAEQFAKSEGL